MYYINMSTQKQKDINKVLVWMKKFLLRLIKNPLFWVCIVCFIVQVFIYREVDQYEAFPDSDSYTYEYNASFRGMKIDGFRTPIYPLFVRIVKLFSDDNNWFVNNNRGDVALL